MVSRMVVMALSSATATRTVKRRKSRNRLRRRLRTPMVRGFYHEAVRTKDNSQGWTARRDSKTKVACAFCWSSNFNGARLNVELRNLPRGVFGQQIGCIYPGSKPPSVSPSHLNKGLQEPGAN